MPTYEMGQWLLVMCHRTQQPSPDYLVAAFPTDEIREAYLSIASERAEQEVRHILRAFVGHSRSLGSFDRLQVLSIEALRKEQGREATKNGWSPRFTEYEIRALNHLSGTSSTPTWEGLTWALDLLPHAPQKAIDVIHAYMYAHAQVLPDLRISGLTDAAELIRTRYILQGSASIETLLELILNLDSRDFEYLVAHLYEVLGYDTEVTPAQKDYGKDVIARKINETVFIECKNWQGHVGVKVISDLAGRVSMEQATRGIVIGTS